MISVYIKVSRRSVYFFSEDSTCFQRPTLPIWQHVTRGWSQNREEADSDFLTEALRATGAWSQCSSWEFLVPASFITRRFEATSPLLGSRPCQDRFCSHLTPAQRSEKPQAVLWRARLSAVLLWLWAMEHPWNARKTDRWVQIDSRWAFVGHFEAPTKKLSSPKTASKPGWQVLLWDRWGKNYRQPSCPSFRTWKMHAWAVHISALWIQQYSLFLKGDVLLLSQQ